MRWLSGRSVFDVFDMEEDTERGRSVAGKKIVKIRKSKYTIENKNQ